MRNDVDSAVARLARRQHGAWSRAQALSKGATSSLIERRLRRGAWVRVDSGVYAAPGAPATWHQSLMAAVLAEPWAVASHRSAAVLHGLVGFRVGRPEVSIRPHANARGRLATTHRAVDTITTKVDGIPCVTAEQVFIDLAQVVSRDRLRVALARATDARPELLEGVRDRYLHLAPRGGRNLRRLRAVLNELAGDGVDESELERRMRRLFTRSDLPPVRWQAGFPGRDPGARRVDGLIEVWRVVLEGDGRAWHARVDDFERDRRRDQAAAAAGYVTLRYSYNQIANDPAWCLETLRQTGARRRTAA